MDSLVYVAEIENTLFKCLRRDTPNCAILSHNMSSTLGALKNEFLDISADKDHYQRYRIRLKSKCSQLIVRLQDLLADINYFPDKKWQQNLRDWVFQYHNFRKHKMNALFEDYLYEIGGES